MRRHFYINNMLFAVGLLGLSSCDIAEGFIDEPISHELSLNIDSIDVAGESREYSFVITTDDEFAVLCQEEWIKLQGLKRNNNKYTQTFHVTKNITDEIRRGKIFITTNYESQSFVVKQGSYPLLVVAEDSLIVSDSENIVNVILLNAIDVDFAFSKEWMFFKEKVSDKVYSIFVAENQLYNSREGYIYINSKIGNQRDSIKIVQHPQNTIILSQKQFCLPKEDSLINVVVKSNIDVECYITTPEWIIYRDAINTRLMKDNHYQYVINENDSRFDRTGNVIYYNYNHNLADSLHIQQQGVESVLRIVYTGSLFDDKITIDGENVYGTIDWGDNVNSEFMYNPNHTYNTEEARKITIRTHNNTGLRINNIVGIEEIDLLEF